MKDKWNYSPNVYGRIHKASSESSRDVDSQKAESLLLLRLLSHESRLERDTKQIRNGDEITSLAGASGQPRKKTSTLWE
jgi:hypothetical protein